MPPPANALPFLPQVAFWFSLSMSGACLIIFCYLAIAEIALRQKEAAARARSLESMDAVGKLAERFGKSGASASALACSVLFMLVGTSIALAVEKVQIMPSFISGVMSRESGVDKHTGTESATK